ncbi:MAG: phospholipase D-like domain-containing protein [Bryobacterales bacterium]|nr:phospholipase D-like domain-containing protein [Bryobacterales bacterium]
MLGSTAQRALVCSPYITSAGVDHLFDALPGHVGLELITRLSPSDWASGVSDPEAIVTLLATWHEGGNQTGLHVVQRLHAKVYSSDDSRVIIGSSNLSEGGFDHNIEFAVELSGDTARTAVSALHTECSPHSREISLDQLRGWVARSRDPVLTARAAAVEEANALSGVQADLDEMLGFGTRSSPPSAVALPDIDPFISWLDARQELPGAEVVLKRHRNADGQNLTGHVKQCFFGSLRFLNQHPHFVAATSDALKKLSAQDLYQMSEPGLQEAWAAHLDVHALDRGESYSYSTLRGILPPSLGGTRQGGGGGMSTLKRLLPLVARCLREGHLRIP